MDSTADVSLRPSFCLEDLRQVGNAAEIAFDRLVFTAAQIFRVPIAFISLIDNDRLRLKSRLGVGCTELARFGTFCTATMEGNGPLVVDDAQMDERFRSSPYVTGRPKLRFYAGVALVAPDGTALGTLSVADTRPQTATDQQLWALCHLARAVIDALLIRLASKPSQA